MSDTFDKLAASRPVNSQTARVMGRGVHYEPNKQITQRHWKSPPACVPIPSTQRNNPNFVDLTGVKFGRFTVIGFLGKFSKKQRAMWLCRCLCGDYESRAGSSVRNPENYGDRCENCRHLAYLKRSEMFRRNPTAKQPDVRDF